MINFLIFGIPVRVLPFFWITMGIIGYNRHEQDPKQAIFNLLLFMIAGFFSILIHELGHALTAKHFGKQVHIVLQAFGGYASYSGGAPLSRMKTFLITAAGPAVQIAAGLLVLLSFRFLPEIGPGGFYFLQIFAIISLFWAVLNLIPVIPMDGGRILETFLGPRNIRLTLMISIGVAVVAALISLNLGFGFILPIFMGFMAYENFKALKQIR